MYISCPSQHPSLLSRHSYKICYYVQNQLVACLQWLGDFQVLACIPLSGSVPIKDVAKVVAVPETQLCRIVRMTATSGFLHEAQHGQVAHTALSALFLSKQSLRDAATFLAETAAPAAMQMMSVTHRYGGSDQTSESAYNIAFDTFQTFESACEQQPKVRRQWLAYLQHIGDADDSITSVLTRLDWINLGNSVVVEVGPFACPHSSKPRLTFIFPIAGWCSVI